MGQTPAKQLYYSFKSGKDDNILQLLTQKDKITTERISRPLNRDKDGNLAIHFAALCGVVNIFEILIKRTDVPKLISENNEKQTILHMICIRCKHKNHLNNENNKYNCLKFIFNYNESLFFSIINKKDDYGMTALHYAAKNNYPYLSRKLIKLGCKINIVLILYLDI